MGALAVVCFALGGCRSYTPDDVVSGSPSTTVEVTTTAPVGSTAPPSTARAGSRPATTAARQAPATTRATMASPAPPAPTTTVKPALSTAEASGRLCDAVIAGDAAVRAGNLVAGGLRLSGGISNYGDAAAPAVTSAARTMLSAGVNGDAEGYVAAREQAAPACAPFGRTVNTGGIRCITFPCP